MPQNQRFTEAKIYLTKTDRYPSDKEFAESVDMKPDRIKYIKNGKAIKPQEKLRLNEIYPDVNWEYVDTGLGSLLVADSNKVEDPETVYLSKAWKKAEILKIKSKASALPLEEQVDILVERLNEVEQALMDIQEINQRGWMETMKEFLKGK
ncbi:MAG: hypothetical protein HWE07_13300 [Cytophagia bacterium]|nr:hypothetical protein [Cytophagia bacterium]